MKVYRYEDEDGDGPLSYGFLSDELTEAMIDAGRYSDDEAEDKGPYHNRFPTPWEDGIAERPVRAMREPRCGTRNLRQLTAWFPKPCRDVLALHGYEVAAYEVPEDAAVVGGVQVVFDASKATKINLAERLEQPLLAA